MPSLYSLEGGRGWVPQGMAESGKSEGGHVGAIGAIKHEQLVKEIFIMSDSVSAMAF